MTPTASAGISDRLLSDAHRLLRAGQYSDAAELYQKFLQAHPRHFEACHALGVTCFQSGQFDRAQYVLAEALRLHPLSFESLSLRGLALLHLRRPREALACFDQALSLKPDSIDTISNRGIAHLELQHFDQALAAFNAVFAIDPNHGVSWSNRGNTLVALRRFGEAVESYDRALATRRDFIQARANRKYALGMTYFEKGEFDRAQSTLDEAVQLNPLLLDALCVRGVALLRLRRRQEALGCFDRALAVNPNFLEALSNRATAYLELERLDEALAGFDAALAIASDHAFSLNNRGNVLMKLKRYEEALASYDKALALHPDFSEAKVNRTWVLFLMRTMSRCPPESIRGIFDEYASFYDTSMLDTLGYRGHLHLRNLAQRVLPQGTHALRILDLGSGTGLVGEAFKGFAQDGRLEGVDISPRMLEKARERGVYDELLLGDIEAFLAEPGRPYDLILAADTMIYFGDLEPAFSGVMQRLAPGGFYLFTVEAMAGTGWEQTEANRFRHSEAYLREQAARRGFAFVELIQCQIRREHNQPVPGFAIALRKPPAS